jgi:hypothetical protein
VNAQREKAERTKNFQRPAPPPPQPQQKRDDRFRNEIEVFLEEIGKRRTGQPNAQQGQPQQTVAQLAQAASAAQRGPAREQPTDKSRPAVRRPVPKRPPTPAVKVESSLTGSRRLGGDLASSRPPESQELGGQVRKHLAEFLDPNRLSQQVQADIGNKVEEGVRSHMGRTLAQSAIVELGSNAKPHPVIALLHDADGVRNAIIINEVLGRPKSLRQR